jgi:hypothetical protein
MTSSAHTSDGEARSNVAANGFLEDGRLVILPAFGERAGGAQIGPGEAPGNVHPALA